MSFADSHHRLGRHHGHSPSSRRVEHSKRHRGQHAHGAHDHAHHALGAHDSNSVAADPLVFDPKTIASLTKNMDGASIGLDAKGVVNINGQPVSINGQPVIIQGVEKLIPAISASLATLGGSIATSEPIASAGPVANDTGSIAGGAPIAGPIARDGPHDAPRGRTRGRSRGGSIARGGPIACGRPIATDGPVARSGPIACGGLASDFSKHIKKAIPASLDGPCVIMSVNPRCAACQHFYNEANLSKAQVPVHMYDTNSVERAADFNALIQSIVEKNIADRRAVLHRNQIFTEYPAVYVIGRDGVLRFYRETNGPKDFTKYLQQFAM